MKKQRNGFILGVLSTLLVIGLVGTAVAATQYRQLNAAYNGIKITLDGVQVPLKDGAGNSIEPFIVDGTTYLPVRAVASALGLSVDWDGATNTVKLTKPKAVQKDVYQMGETWVVDGQWEFTITGVRETTERNNYSDKTPCSVYIVDYTYKNIGYVDDIWDGLYIPMTDTVVDSAGKMGYSYSISGIWKNAKETPVGATCEAQGSIGVETPGNFQLTFSRYDGNSVRQRATFNVKVN